MAHYDFYAKKKVTSPGAWINRVVVRRLARLCIEQSLAAGTEKPAILEIGPGKGGFAENLLHSGSIIYKGYEGDKLLFDGLKAQGFDVVNAMVPPIPEPPDFYDSVVLNNVLEHMPGLKAAEELVNESFRILRKNGCIFVVVPNYLAWGKDFFNLDYTHQFITTEIRCKQLLEDCGFRVKTIRYHYGCFFSGFGRLFDFSAQICRAILTIFLPRSLSRSDPVQKLGVLFAENIICIAEKQ